MMAYSESLRGRRPYLAAACTPSCSPLVALRFVVFFFLGGSRIQADKSNCCKNLIATFLILDSCALQTCDLESLSSILRTISCPWAPRRVDTWSSAQILQQFSEELRPTLLRK